MNLVQEVLKQFGGDSLGQLASLVGGSSGDVDKALKAAVPSVLAGLTGLAGQGQGGVDKIASALKGVEGGGFDLSDLLKGGAPKVEEVSKTGNSILEGLMGKAPLAALLLGLGKFLGGSGLITKLLPLLAPRMLSMITKQMKSGGFGVADLAKLLLSQKSGLVSALPAGLGSVLSGVQGLGDLSGVLGAVSAPTSSPAKHSRPVEEPAGAGKWLPLMLIPLLLGGLYFLFGRGGSEPTRTGPALGKAGLEEAAAKATEMTGKAADTVKDVAEKAKDAAAAATENLDELLGDAGVALKGKFTDYFSGLTGALDGIKDADTAKAALPKLEEMEGSLGGLIGSVKELPEAARPFFNEMVAGSQKAIADKVTSVLGLPGVEEILKPVLDKIIGLIGGFLKG